MLLKLITYNVHSCRSGRLEPTLQEISEVIRSVSPDLVALQELDRGCLRTGEVDQLGELARRTEMKGYYSPLVRMDGGEYGIGFLVRESLCVRDPATHFLPKATSENEQRGLFRLDLEDRAHPLTFFNTHLSVNGREQRVQVEEVLRVVRGALDAERRVVLLGDFNALRGSRTRRRLARALHYCGPRGALQATFPSRYPVFLLDGIYVSPRVEAAHGEILRDPLARRASDHLPMVSRMRLPELPR